MLQFSYRLRVAERVKANANGIPPTTPSVTGEVESKADARPASLYDLHQARLSLDSAHREFLRKATPWTRSTKPRSKAERNGSTDAASAPP